MERMRRSIYTLTLVLVLAIFTIYSQKSTADDYEMTDNPGFPNVPQDVTPIPEPTTIILLSLGLAGLAAVEVRRRRKKKAIDKN